MALGPGMYEGVMGVAGVATAPFSLPGFVIAAGITVLAGSLLGKMGKKSSFQRPPLLLDVAQSQSFQGGPAVYAMGHRIRTPAFCMYRQTPQRNQGSSGSGKGGSQARSQVRQVRYDVAYAVNHRKTNRVIRLDVNGKAAYYTERNFRFLEDYRWAATTPGGGVLVITAADRGVPDFSKEFTPVKKFAGTATGGTGTTIVFPAASFVAHEHAERVVWVVSGTGIGQFARIQDNTTTTLTFKTGFTFSPVTNGTSFCEIDGTGHDVILRGWGANDGYLTVYAATPHTFATLSTLTLVPRSGQTIAAVSGGTEIAPARIERADNAIVDNHITVPNVSGNILTIVSPQIDPYTKFRSGDFVVLRNFRTTGPTAALNGGNFRVKWIGGASNLGYSMQIEANGWAVGAGPFDAGLYNTAGRIEWDTQSRFLSGTMDGATFNQGDETQTTDPTLVARLGADIPAFRGCAYIVVQQWNGTELGNAPNSCEVVQEPDAAYGNLAQPIQELFERVGVSAAFVDASACTGIIYPGSYLRGAQSSLDHLGSLLLFYQVASQDRGGTVHFFPISACPQVLLLNDEDRTEMGVGISSEYAPKQVESSAEEKDLPASVTVRYQDVGKSMLDAEATFGLRNPSAEPNPSKDELNFTFLASHSSVARDSATTILRRTHTNARRFALPLGIRRLNLLENDAPVWTDDEGETHIARIVTAMVNTNDWTLQAQCVEEDLELDVAGSPVEAITDSPPLGLVAHAEHNLVVLDVPPLDDVQAYQPGVYVGGGVRVGGVWRGATIWGSLDGGNHYSLFAKLDTELTIGESTDVLADGVPSEDAGGGTTIDASAQVTVRLDSLGVDGGLSSCTTADALAGANRFMLGDEIMAFETATGTDDPNVWLLQDLYRGLRGTPCSGHSIGERFVLLSNFAKDGGKFVPISGAAIGDTVDIKLVPAGQTLAEVTAESFALEFWGVRPLPPYDAGSGFLTASGSNFIFAPLPKTRLNVPLGSSGPFPFDESFEEFILTLYTDGTYASVAGTLTFTSRTGGVAITQRLLSRTTLYTAAMQTADGFTPTITPGTLYYGVKQVGDFGGGAASREWRGVV